MHTPSSKNRNPHSDPDGWAGAPWISLDRFCSVMPIYSAAVYSLAVCFAFAHYTFPAEVSPTHTADYGVCMAKKKGAGDAEVFIFQRKTSRTRETKAGQPLGNSESAPHNSP